MVLCFHYMKLTIAWKHDCTKSIKSIKSNIFDNTKKQNKQTDENEKNNYKMYSKEQ